MSPFLFLPSVDCSLEPTYSRMCKNVATKNFPKFSCGPDARRQEAVLLMSAQHLIFVF